ncbi:hypothetical protein AAIA72_10020 [Hahella sp. SMD15-11]|uniref:Small-conductance mechanosensitive channel n=1 Tax=Thermohahella caldifontis TaxID=3142973 RepID=A0AB39USZ5_9GAMM
MNLDAWTQAFGTALSNFWGKIAEFAPNVLATLFIVLAGLYVARLIGQGVALALRKLGMDSLCDKIGLTGWLKTAGLDIPPSQALAGLFRIFLILLIILSAAETLGLERISAVVDEFVLYLPRLFGAIAVVVAGMFIAHHLKRSVGRTLKHMGVDYARAVAQTVYGITLLITASVAINQLDIATGLFDLFFAIVLASIGLAVAISFGLGARGVSEQLISGVYLREQLVPGETLIVDGEEGVVLAVGNVNTLVQVGNEMRRIPNAVLLKSAFSTRNDDTDAD